MAHSETTGEMLTGVNLPDEFIPEILTRLPTKSLVRFKSVSKPWKSLISSPKFNLSFQNSRCRSKILYLSSEQQSLAVIDFNCKPLVSSKLNLNQSHKWLRFYGSCNGLALALNSRSELCLFNPTTKECRTLPNPSHVILVSKRFTCGLGYDSTTDDYKVVVISESRIVNVYRLNCNCWYKFLVFPRRLPLCFNLPGVFANGCLNWFEKISSPLSMTAFDLAEDKFRQVPLPRILDIGSDLASGPNGHIDGIDMLIMKEYGLFECKTKISLEEYRAIRPLIVLNDDEFMLDISGRTVVYNAEERTSREIVIHGLSAGWGYKCHFVESLISLEHLR